MWSRYPPVKHDPDRGLILYIQLVKLCKIRLQRPGLDPFRKPMIACAPVGVKRLRNAATLAAITHTIRGNVMTRLQNAIGFVLALAMAVSFGHVPLFAQFTTASLGGIVSDSTGSAVPDAKVTVENLDTNLTRTVTTRPRWFLPLSSSAYRDLSAQRLPRPGFRGISRRESNWPSTRLRRRR